MSTPTPPPWIAEGYELRQKHGRMIAYFGPHHTPADEYPLSCRLQDEANCQWVAALPAALTAEREKVRVLREALEQVGELVEQMVCVPISEEPVVSAKAYGIIALTVAADISADIDAALAAAKEEIK